MTSSDAPIRSSSSTFRSFRVREDDASFRVRRRPFFASRGRGRDMVNDCVFKTSFFASCFELCEKRVYACIPTGWVLSCSLSLSPSRRAPYARGS